MTLTDAMDESIYGARGRVLQFAIEMEMLLDEFIAKHFTKDKDKMEDFKFVVLGPRIDLMEKKEILVYILNKAGRKAEAKEFSKTVTKIVEDRNMFAHCPISYSRSSKMAFRDQKIFRFMKIKEGKYDGKVFTGHMKDFHQNHVNKLLLDITEVNKKLLALINE